MGIITVDITGTGAREPTEDRDKPPHDIAAVIALDPGETTGWSLMVVDPRCLVNPAVKVLSSIYEHQHGQVTANDREDPFPGVGRQVPEAGECLMVNDLIALLDTWDHAAVVIEDFILRKSSKGRELLSPVRVTAAIKQFLWCNGRGFFRQQVSEAKTAATDDRLKVWGMYQRDGGLEHARDADRHAITFLRKATQSAKLRAEAWPHLFPLEQKANRRA